MKSESCALTNSDRQPSSMRVESFHESPSWNKPWKNFLAPTSSIGKTYYLPPPSNHGPDSNSQGGFFFSQAALPRLLKGTKQDLQYPPTLLFTGATASLKGSAQFSSFAVGKFATRAMAQSLAREFGPQGVHVGHIIIDGVIDLPTSKEYLKDAGPDAKIDPNTVSEAI